MLQELLPSFANTECLLLTLVFIYIINNLAVIDKLQLQLQILIHVETPITITITQKSVMISNKSDM